MRFWSLAVLLGAELVVSTARLLLEEPPWPDAAKTLFQQCNSSSRSCPEMKWNGYGSRNDKTEDPGRPPMSRDYVIHVTSFFHMPDAS